MIELKDLLSRFDKILSSNTARKNIVAETIKEIAGFDVETKNINIKGDTIYLFIKPIYKNELFLKKDMFFRELEKKLDKNTLKKIL